MIASRTSVYLSPEDYLASEMTSQVKHEYIDGEIFAMSGASDDYSDIVFNLSNVLREAALDRNCRLSADVKAKIFQCRRYYYPDLMLTCDERDRGNRYVKQYYKLIVEVLSDSTEAFDRGRKFEDYRRVETLEEYVLVSQDRMNVEIYRLNAANRWELQVYQAGDVVEFTSLGVSCKIEALYRGVKLPSESQQDGDAV